MGIHKNGGKIRRYFSLFIFSITSGSPNSQEGILDTEAGPDIGDMDQFTEEEFRYNILYPKKSSRALLFLLADLFILLIFLNSGWP